MRSGSSLKSVEKYDEHRQNSKKVPKATRKNKNHSSKNTLTQSISTLHKRAKKKSSSNAFARGKNQQNYKNQNSLNSNDSNIDDINEDEYVSDWEANDFDDEKKEAPKKSRKKADKKAGCWLYFGQKQGLNKKKKPCLINFCKIVVDGKICGQEFIAHSGTSHMNEHLYVDHEKQEFRPRRLYGVPAVREINELMAKFIVSANLAFNIVENKYLVVSFLIIKRVLFNEF